MFLVRDVRDLPISLEHSGCGLSGYGFSEVMMNIEKKTVRGQRSCGQALHWFYTFLIMEMCLKLFVFF